VGLEPSRVGKELLVLRHGHYNGRVSAAVTRSRICNFAAGLGRPASLLRDGHYNSRVSAAVTTVSLCSLAFALWASAARHRGHQLKEHVRACLPFVPMVTSTTKAGSVRRCEPARANENSALRATKLER
jgi:hypothetical protein